MYMYDPAMFPWIDETGCDLRNSMRKYGYSIKGVPPRNHGLMVRGTRYSTIPVEGVLDVHIVEGTTNSEFQNSTITY